MPSVKVCLWNIQNYGQQATKYGGQAGYANELRNRYLSRFIRAQALDVVLIQEVQPGAQTSLADLVTRLNALYPAGQRDWAYSFCGCAIRADDVDEVTAPGDLIDRTGARSECYGVLWRQRRNARFTMIEGLHQIARATTLHVRSPLNISQLGRPSGQVTDGLGRRTFGATGGFERDEVFPWELDPMDGQYALMDEWPKLNYPRTSIMDTRTPNWSKSRRPAYVVIKLNDAEDTLCPIAAYHAPSNEQLASWGAFMTGLARELYVVDDVDAHDDPTPAQDPVLANAGFFGGDFNYSVDQADWPSDYRYFNDPRSHNLDGGANLSEVPAHTDPAPDRRTTVQIIEGVYHDTPIVSANVDDYFRMKLDLGFHRAIPDITATRVDLLTDVMANAGGIYDDALVQTEAYMAYIEAQIANLFNPSPQRLTPTGPQYWKTKKVGRRTFASWAPLICGSWGGTFTNWATSRAQFAAHNITDARRAAEFIHIFITDHLPLIATIDL